MNFAMSVQNFARMNGILLIHNNRDKTYQMQNGDRECELKELPDGQVQVAYIDADGMDEILLVDKEECIPLLMNNHQIIRG